MPQNPWAIGIDLGGTKVEMAQVDASGALGERLLFPTNVKGGPDAIIKEIAEAAKTLVEKAGTNPVGIGIGIPGQLDSVKGVVSFAPNLRWHNVPIQSELTKALGIPIIIVNDVRAAAWSEWLHGAGKGVDDLVCLFVGTGIGGGIVSGGHMLSGSNNSAGEVGHMTVDLYGPLCTCGNTGCLEALASGWAIARRIEEGIQDNPEAGAMLLKLNNGKPKGVTATTLFKAANEGDPLAKVVIEEISLALIAGSVGLVNAFNPKRLILGGGVIRAIPELIVKVTNGVRQRALQSATESLEVLGVQFTENPGIIGAGSLAFRTFASNQGAIK